MHSCRMYAIGNFTYEHKWLVEIYVLNKRTIRRENGLQRLFSPHPLNTTLRFSLGMTIRDSVGARHIGTQVKAAVQLSFLEPPNGHIPKLQGSQSRSP